LPGLVDRARCLKGGVTQKILLFNPEKILQEKERNIKSIFNILNDNFDKDKEDNFDASSEATVDPKQEWFGNSGYSLKIIFLDLKICD
jgi:hypothetical protein